MSCAARVYFSVIPDIKHALLTSLVFDSTFCYEQLQLDEEHQPFKAKW
jgi:hypothetical protein